MNLLVLFIFSAFITAVETQVLMSSMRKLRSLHSCFWRNDERNYNIIVTDIAKTYFRFEVGILFNSETPENIPDLSIQIKNVNTSKVYICINFYFGDLTEPLYKYQEAGFLMVSVGVSSFARPYFEALLEINEADSKGAVYNFNLIEDNYALIMLFKSYKYNFEYFYSNDSITNSEENKNQLKMSSKSKTKLVSFNTEEALKLYKNSLSELENSLPYIYVSAPGNLMDLKENSDISNYHRPIMSSFLVDSNSDYDRFLLLEYQLEIDGVESMSMIQDNPLIYVLKRYIYSSFLFSTSYGQPYLLCFTAFKFQNPSQSNFSSSLEFTKNNVSLNSNYPQSFYDGLGTIYTIYFYVFFYFNSLSIFGFKYDNMSDLSLYTKIYPVDLQGIYKLDEQLMTEIYLFSMNSSIKSPDTRIQTEIAQRLARQSLNFKPNLVYFKANLDLYVDYKEYVMESQIVDSYCVKKKIFSDSFFYIYLIGQNYFTLILRPLRSIDNKDSDKKYFLKIENDSNTNILSTQISTGNLSTFVSDYGDININYSAVYYTMDDNNAILPVISYNLEVNKLISNQIVYPDNLAFGKRGGYSLKIRQFLEYNYDLGVLATTFHVVFTIINPNQTKAGDCFLKINSDCFKPTIYNEFNNLATDELSYSSAILVYNVQSVILPLLLPNLVHFYYKDIVEAFYDYKYAYPTIYFIRNYIDLINNSSEKIWIYLFNYDLLHDSNNIFESNFLLKPEVLKWMLDFEEMKIEDIQTKLKIKIDLTFKRYSSKGEIQYRLVLTPTSAAQKQMLFIKGSVVKHTKNYLIYLSLHTIRVDCFTKTSNNSIGIIIMNPFPEASFIDDPNNSYNSIYRVKVLNKPGLSCQNVQHAYKLQIYEANNFIINGVFKQSDYDSKVSNPIKFFKTSTKYYYPQETERVMVLSMLDDWLLVVFGDPKAPITVKREGISDFTAYSFFICDLKEFVGQISFYFNDNYFITFVSEINNMVVNEKVMEINASKLESANDLNLSDTSISSSYLYDRSNFYSRDIPKTLRELSTFDIRLKSSYVYIPDAMPNFQVCNHTIYSTSNNLLTYDNFIAGDCYNAIFLMTNELIAEKSFYYQFLSRGVKRVFKFIAYDNLDQVHNIQVNSESDLQRVCEVAYNQTNRIFFTIQFNLQPQNIHYTIHENGNFDASKCLKFISCLIAINKKLNKGSSLLIKRFIWNIKPSNSELLNYTAFSLQFNKTYISANTKIESALELSSDIPLKTIFSTYNEFSQDPQTLIISAEFLANISDFNELVSAALYIFISQTELSIQLSNALVRSICNNFNLADLEYSQLKAFNSALYFSVLSILPNSITSQLMDKIKVALTQNLESMANKTEGIEALSLIGLNYSSQLSTLVAQLDYTIELEVWEKLVEIMRLSIKSRLSTNFQIDYSAFKSNLLLEVLVYSIPSSEPNFNARIFSNESAIYTLFSLDSDANFTLPNSIYLISTLYKNLNDNIILFDFDLHYNYLTSNQGSTNELMVWKYPNFQVNIEDSNYICLWLYTDDTRGCTHSIPATGKFSNDNFRLYFNFTQSLHIEISQTVIIFLSMLVIYFILLIYTICSDCKSESFFFLYTDESFAWPYCNHITQIHKLLFMRRLINNELEIELDLLLSSLFSKIDIENEDHFKLILYSKLKIMLSQENEVGDENSLSILHSDHRQKLSNQNDKVYLDKLYRSLRAKLPSTAKPSLSDAPSSRNSSSLRMKGGDDKSQNSNLLIKNSPQKKVNEKPNIGKLKNLQSASVAEIVNKQAGLKLLQLLRVYIYNYVADCFYSNYEKNLLEAFKLSSADLKYFSSGIEVHTSEFYDKDSHFDNLLVKLEIIPKSISYRRLSIIIKYHFKLYYEPLSLFTSSKKHFYAKSNQIFLMLSKYYIFLGLVYDLLLDELYQSFSFTTFIYVLCLLFLAKAFLLLPSIYLKKIRVKCSLRKKSQPKCLIISKCMCSYIILIFSIFYTFFNNSLVEKNNYGKCSTYWGYVLAFYLIVASPLYLLIKSFLIWTLVDSSTCSDFQKCGMKFFVNF